MKETDKVARRLALLEGVTLSKPDLESIRSSHPVDFTASPASGQKGLIMAAADILELFLTDLSRLIAARELSSSEATRAALTRLELLENRLNAFITVLAERALACAKKADEEIARGNYRGPLHGVPVTIKDMFETAGVLTTGGSKILADWIPETDAALVERLREAGAIIIGKTNLDEFGHGGTSTSNH